MKNIEIHLVDLSTSLPLPYADEGIRAGFPSPAQDYMEQAIDLNKELIKHPASTFYGRVVGDSMKDAGIDEGDLLVFEKTSSVYNGMIGAFCIDEFEAVCKKYTEVNGMIILQPMNSSYDPIPVDPLNEHFRCVGKLKKSIKNFND